MEIPGEVLCQILLGLRTSDIINIRQVCAEWVALVDSDYFWKRFFDVETGRLTSFHVKTRRYVWKTVCRDYHCEFKYIYLIKKWIPRMYVYGYASKYLDKSIINIKTADIKRIVTLDRFHGYMMWQSMLLHGNRFSEFVMNLLQGYEFPLHMKDIIPIATGYAIKVDGDSEACRMLCMEYADYLNYDAPGVRRILKIAQK